MKSILILFIGLTGVLFLGGCGGELAAEPPDALSNQPQPGVTEGIPEKTTALETAVDEQGEVKVAVTPVNLARDASTLDFEVVLDTHSVDLSMDLASLATLTTDNGRSVLANRWDGMAGGHHVSGFLSFPASADGVALLEGAAQLTLTIRDVDAPARIFTWPLADQS